MDRMLGMEVFVQVIEQGSFTKAAGALQMSTGMVSTHIAHLESRLGVRLINRTTRSLALTEDGEAYFALCQRILSEVAETESLLARSRTTPRGRIRVDLPATLSTQLFLPILPEFFERYPEIALELNASDHAFDLAPGGFDVLIRMGPFEDSNLIARTLGYSRLLIVASPDYLARHGEPATPQDLLEHRCINFIDPAARRVIPWYFDRDGEHLTIAVPGNLTFNQGEARVLAALRGLGIVSGLGFHVTPLIRRGLLKHILPDWVMRAPPIAALYPRSQHLSAKVRAFVDFVIEKYPPDKEIEVPDTLPAP